MFDEGFVSAICKEHLQLQYEMPFLQEAKSLNRNFTKTHEPYHTFKKL